MFEFINTLIETIRDLLLDKSQPFKVWVIRYLIIVFSIIGGFYVFFFTIRGTPLSEKLGFSSPVPTVVLPTATEFAYSNRFILNQLSVYQDKNKDTTSGIFLISIFDKMLNDFNTNKPGSNLDFLIWTWSIRSVQSYADLETLDFTINNNKDFIFNTGFQSLSFVGCYVGETPTKVREMLNKTFKNKLNDKFIACPMYDRNKRFTISFTLSFFTAIDPLEANVLSYNQQQLTIEISRVFSKYTIPYSLSK